MFCTSCGKQLSGGEAFCPYCGGKQPPQQPGVTWTAGMPYAQVNAKPGLRGFAKGWTIFMIVMYSAYIAQNLTNLANASMDNLLFPAIILLLGLMDFGSVLMFRMKPYGFYIQLGASLLFLMLSGISSGQYVVTTSGSIFVFVSWMATKKQLDYTFPKKKLEDFILLEGFEQIWVIFIIGYLACQTLLSMINIDYYNYYPYQYIRGYLILTLCGAGAILGAGFILNKRNWGLLLMLASILIRMFAIDSRVYGNVFRMSDAAINRLGLTVIIGLAPALLTWLFTREKINYGFGAKTAVASVLANVRAARPAAPAPDVWKGQQQTAHPPLQRVWPPEPPRQNITVTSPLTATQFEMQKAPPTPQNATPPNPQKAAPANQTPGVMDEAELKRRREEQDINKAVDTLVSECRWHFSNSDNYMDMKNEFSRREREIVRPIGEKLNETGGLALMRKVYEQVEEKCGRSCRSALDMKWNGIGDWRG